MTGLIKNGPDPALLGIRPIAAAPILRDDRGTRLRREVERLKTALEEKEAAAETLDAAREQARQDGFDQGYLVGLAAADDGRHEREARLAKGIEAALADKQTMLADSERLAALLARECLARMFGDVADRAALVSDLIARQLARIDAASVVAVSVSAQDFDPPSLARLAAHFDQDTISVRASGDLPSGSCKFGLVLGELDLGLDQQWSVLRALLEEFAGGDTAG